MRRAGRPCGFRGVPRWRRRLLILSSTASKQAAGRRVGLVAWAAVFSFKQRRSGGACGHPLGWRCLVPSGGDDTRGLIVFTAVSPSVPYPIIHPHIEQIRRQASRQGARWGGFDDRITADNEDKQARRERRITSPRFLSSHGPTTPHGFHHTTQPPRPTTNTTRRTTRRRRTQDDGTHDDETTRQRDGKQERDDGTPDDETTGRDAARDARRQG